MAVNDTLVYEQNCEEQDLLHKNTSNLGDETKKLKKAVYRRTIDYNASTINYLRDRNWISDVRDRPMMQPDYLWSPKLRPPRSYMDKPMNCVMSKPVRTSTNKNKCPIYCVCWTPEGRRLITGAFSGEFTLWNGLTFNFETILQAHESQIRCMKWSHNEEWLLTADHSGYIKYWQANMNNVEMYQAHKEPIRGVSFCPFDNKFVTCSDDSTVRIWDFHQCSEERVLRGHGSDVRTVAWHPVLSLIISGSKDAQQPIKLWDPKTGESVSTLYVHKNTCTDVSWNDNGNWFLTASRDHLIKLFDLRNLKTELQTFRGHKRDVMRVAWHPFHECLFASGSADGAIFYWMAGSDTELGAVDNAHESMIWSLAWHPFGHILVSGANDFATKFWTRNRPGDVLKETLSLTGVENVSQTTTNYSLNGTISLESEAVDNSYNFDSVKLLEDPSVISLHLDAGDEVAFSTCASENNIEIPGLNEGPVTDLNMNSQNDLEDRDKNKSRSIKTIPKDFALNWESARMNAMPTVMVPAPNPSALAAAAAAAAVAVNNLNSAPQYLPPVKPKPPMKPQQVPPNNFDHRRPGDNDYDIRKPMPSFGNPPYDHPPMEMHPVMPPDTCVPNWNNRNKNYHDNPNEQIPSTQPRGFQDHIPHEPFDTFLHKHLREDGRRNAEDHDYRECVDPHGRRLPVHEPFYDDSGPRYPPNNRNMQCNEPTRSHGRLYPSNDRRKDHFQPPRPLNDDENRRRGWPDNKVSPNYYDFDPSRRVPPPRENHNQGFYPDRPNHTQSKRSGGQHSDHLAKYSRSETSSKSRPNYDRW